MAQKPASPAKKKPVPSRMRQKKTFETHSYHLAVLDKFRAGVLSREDLSLFLLSPAKFAAQQQSQRKRKAKGW